MYFFLSSVTCLWNCTEDKNGEGAKAKKLYNEFQESTAKKETTSHRYYVIYHVGVLLGGGIVCVRVFV